MIPSEPILNPAMPLIENLVGGLKVGSLLTLNGAIPNSAKSFQINFACGSIWDANSPQRSPIAFHFNPRFHERFVARNTLSHLSMWGSEESASPGKPFPFVTGHKFELMILVEEKEFKVAVNGRHFINFVHRIPVDTINTLNIVGDIEIFKILLETEQTESETIHSAEIIEAIYDPDLPFSCNIPNGMSVGRIIFISGRPLPYPSRFAFDLLCEDPYSSIANIALHFNPRFSKPNCIVRNSQIDGKWGTEETSGTIFPFERNISFDIKICCEEKRYVIYVNGQHFCVFVHRLSYECVSKLQVEGDIAISSIIFQ